MGTWLQQKIEILKEVIFGRGGSTAKAPFLLAHFRQRADTLRLPIGAEDKNFFTISHRIYEFALFREAVPRVPPWLRLCRGL